MINRKQLIDRFNMGMSVFSYYIKFNGICNLYDINIEAESFIGDLCRILYGWDLRNENSVFQNNAGYDLISEKDKIIIQISSRNEPEKVKETLQKLQKVIQEKPYLSGYTLYFAILSFETDEVSKYKGRDNYGYKCPDGILFNQKENIYNFSTLVKKVHTLSEVSDADKMSSLKAFMNGNRGLFGPFEPIVSVKNNIDVHIKEYAENFHERLFRHLYKETEVTLERVFVQPEIEDPNDPSRKLVSILGSFLWNERETRILFIEGDAACGKSSFISYLCYHYREKDEIGRGIFLQGNLICIRLRDLEIDEKKRTVEESIREYLGFSDDNDYIENKIRFDNYVLILDGADELSMLEGYGKSSLEEILKTIRKIFRKNKIIVTTRPQYIDYEKLISPTFEFKVVQMKHFDKKMREEWITKYEECGEKISPETKNYILNIDEERAVGVADTPLALYLLAACKMREELQGNIWALYHEIFTNAIIETEYDENFNSSAKHPIKKNKNLLLEIVSRIAFEIFKKSEKEIYHIQAEELDSIVNEFNLEPSNAKWIRKCCVLCAYWKSDGTDGALEFYHNNIRDYFFCEYIYNKINNCLMTDSVEYVQVFLDCVCEILSYGEIAGSTWGETFLFLYERLRYEGRKVSKDVEEYEKLLLGKRLYSIFSNVLCSDTIWKYSYGGNNYQRMKYTVSNALMLIRVWQEGLGIDMQGRKNTFAECRTDTNYIVKSNVLSDWSWIFKNRIQVSLDKSISIGQNCMFRNISFERKYYYEENFENCIFESILFNKCIFEKTSFENSFLNNIVFRDCSFIEGTSFTNATMQETHFLDDSFQYANFNEAKLCNCKFEGTTIINGKFNRSTIENCKFDGNFENVFFIGASLINNEWTDVKFIGGDISSAAISESDSEHLVSLGVLPAGYSGDH